MVEVRIPVGKNPARPIRLWLEGLGLIEAEVYQYRTEWNKGFAWGAMHVYTFYDPVLASECILRFA